MEIKNILSFDAETNGLWGDAFSIGALLYKNGVEVSRFIGRCPIRGNVDKYVNECVLPEMTTISVTHSNYEHLLKDFMKWRAENKEGATEIVHMGVPVEAKLFYDARRLGYIGDFDGPYPLVDVSAIPEIGDSVDTYNKKYGIAPDSADFAGGTHNPLYDSAAAAAAYMHWLARYKEIKEFWKKEMLRICTC